MGCKGSEVRILSPRPINIEVGSEILVTDFFFFGREAMQEPDTGIADQLGMFAAWPGQASSVENFRRKSLFLEKAENLG